MALDWMEKLQPGDEVFFRGEGRDCMIKVVKRVTVTQVIIEFQGFELYERRFSKRDGLEVGSAPKWRRAYIDELTDARRAEVKERIAKQEATKLRRDILGHISNEAMSLAKLREIAKLLELPQ